MDADAMRTIEPMPNDKDQAFLHRDQFRLTYQSISVCQQKHLAMVNQAKPPNHQHGDHSTKREL
jgi:hypothetical protein